MFLSPRAGMKELAEYCRRMATGLDAGVDILRILEREATGRSRRTFQEQQQRILDAVKRGATLPDAIHSTGEFFPLLVREMVEVGEETGQLPNVFRKLADFYENQLRLRRNFLAAITWPMLQLTAAIVVIAIVILLLGLIPAGPDGKRTDILGFGLIGVKGVIIYFLIIGLIGGAIAGVIVAARRGVFWARPIQRAITSFPVVGDCIQTLALSRFCWSAALTFNTSMDLRRAIPLAFRATTNARYTDHAEQVVADVEAGHEVFEAFERTRVFPRDFLDQFEVGERSGSLPDSLRRMSEEYDDRGRRALVTLSVVAGFAVWGIVALIIIILIFRFALFYTNTLYDLMK